MMRSTHDNINGYVTNLGKYNEGYLIGEWIEFPIDEEEFQEALSRIGVSSEPDENGIYYEEYFFTDWEIPVEWLKFGEYPNLEEVQSAAEEIERLSDYELDLLDSIIDATGEDFYSVLERIDKEEYFVFSGCDNMTEVAMYYVEESGLLSGVDLTIANFFDYEAYGEFLDSSRWFIEGEINNKSCIIELF